MAESRMAVSAWTRQITAVRREALQDHEPTLADDAPIVMRADDGNNIGFVIIVTLVISFCAMIVAGKKKDED